MLTHEIRLVDGVDADGRYLCNTETTNRIGGLIAITEHCVAVLG